MDMRTPDRATALAVDLDGTLIATDLLYECALRLLRRNPLLIILFPYWLTLGKARFKYEIFRRLAPEPEALPYRHDVIDFIKDARSRGRHVVLATASDVTHAQAIADHLDLFDAVVGSNRAVNLRGARKADLLESRYGVAGFDYMGNSADDVAVFDKAREAIVVAPDNVAAEWAVRHEAHVVAPAAPPGPRTYFKMLRVHQWAKNVLIAVPAVLDHRILEPSVFFQFLVAFFAFSFLASAVYIFNDLFDLAADRKHPTKRERPLAACQVTIPAGFGLACGLMLASAVLTLMLPPLFWLVLAGYFVITSAYSLRLKQMMLIDVLVLAGLYTVRVIAGAAATATAPSFWLLAFSVFFFLSLALVKRYVELDQSCVDAKQKLSGRGYRPEDKAVISQAGMASGFAAVVVLALYLDSPAIYSLYSVPWLVWPLCPLVLYIIIRIWILAQRAEFNDDPVVFIMTDWRSQVMIGLGALMLLAGALINHA